MEGKLVPKGLQEEGVPILVNDPLNLSHVANLKEIFCKDVPEEGEERQASDTTLKLDVGKDSDI